MDGMRAHRPPESEHDIEAPTPAAIREELEQARAQVAAAIERYREGGAADRSAAQKLAGGVVATVELLRARDAASTGAGLPSQDAQTRFDPELAAEARLILQGHFGDLVPKLLDGVVAQRPIPDEVDRILKAMLYLDRLATHQELGAAV